MELVELDDYMNAAAKAFNRSRDLSEWISYFRGFTINFRG
jgi:hypothetical protein